MTPKERKKYLAEFSAMVHGDEHGKYCACWQCIGRLQAWVVRTRKEALAASKKQKVG
jgi:hypothetical protein